MLLFVPLYYSSVSLEFDTSFKMSGQRKDLRNASYQLNKLIQSKFIQIHFGIEAGRLASRGGQSTRQTVEKLFAQIESQTDSIMF